MSEQVTITINGKQVQAEAGRLLIDVCAEQGIDIPHFCYHPGLGPDGNCRMCQVEFVSERGNRLGISCKAEVHDGMEVNTESEAAKAARASVEEMLLLNHPLDCPICDKSGECTLQNYYMEHDLKDSRQSFTRFKKDKAVDLGPTLVLDQERCVLCDRCVRFLRDVAGDEQLHIAGRGHEAFISKFPGKEVDSAYSINTVDLCPVGALTAKDFRFASPTWFLDKTPTTCTSCSRGCSMEINSKKGPISGNHTGVGVQQPGQVHRQRPRFNPDVNGHWMCDHGRTNYKFVNDARITESAIRRGAETIEITFDEALAELRSLMGFAPVGAVGDSRGSKALLLASANCTLEELYQLKKLAADHLSADLMVARHVPDGIEDQLLRKSDQHANTKGAELLGIPVLDLTGANQGDESKAESAAANAVLCCVGFNVSISQPLERVARAAAKVIAISACITSLTERADLIVAGLTYAEKDGLVVNFEGHTQRLKPAWEIPTTSEWQTFELFRASLTGETGAEFVSHVRKAIAENEPAFSGVDLVNVGPRGIRVSGQPVG